MMAAAAPRHPIFARLYARASPGMEREMAAHRRRLLTGLAGRVIEVGAGNGMNFGHYPPGVTSVLAVEPEPLLREIARHYAQRAPVDIEVVAGVAERLPAPDATFDAAVVTLVLCSVTDQRSATDELYRVVRPGGELRFIEHVRASTRGLAAVQRLVDATVWPRLLGGCHTGRDTMQSLIRAGFRVERVDRLKVPDMRLTLPSSPHVLGMATRSA